MFDCVCVVASQRGASALCKTAHITQRALRLNQAQISACCCSSLASPQISSVHAEGERLEIYLFQQFLITLLQLFNMYLFLKISLSPQEI